MCGGFGGAQCLPPPFLGYPIPVRKAKPASIPSRCCSVSLLWGVAVSHTISPREPKPLSRLNWGGGRRGGVTVRPPTPPRDMGVTGIKGCIGMGGVMGYGGARGYRGVWV